MPVQKYETISILETICAAIRAHGYLSKSAAKGRTNSVPTSALVREIYGDPTLAGAAGVEITETDRAMASEVAEWARGDLIAAIPKNGLLPDSRSFEFRMANALASDEIAERQIATACAAAQQYLRDRGETREAKDYQARFENSRHFGDLDERNIWPVEIVEKRPIASKGRTIWLVNMLTPRGDLAVWWASSEPAVSPGTRTLVCGTIQRHDAYQGVAQTVLSRCTFQHGAASTMADDAATPELAATA